MIVYNPESSSNEFVTRKDASLPKEIFLFYGSGVVRVWYLDGKEEHHLLVREEFRHHQLAK